MSKETVLDNEYFTLWYYPSTKIVHHQIHQTDSGEPYRQLLSAGLTLFEKHGACKWLSDDRRGTGLAGEDIQWSTQNWMPQMMEAGWKYWAIVMPEKLSGQMDLQKGAERHIQDGVQVRLFEVPQEAMAWLESMR